MDSLWFGKYTTKVGPSNRRVALVRGTPFRRSQLRVNSPRWAIRGVEIRRNVAGARFSNKTAAQDARCPWLRDRKQHRGNSRRPLRGVRVVGRDVEGLGPESRTGVSNL